MGRQPIDGHRRCRERTGGCGGTRSCCGEEGRPGPIARRSENGRLRVENAELGREAERLRAENERLTERVHGLEARVEELRRAAQRQAAPFSRGEPKRKPRRAGRRPGEDYGQRARRPVPERVDEELFVPLPAVCPGCGGGVRFDGIAHPYQEDIPPPKRTQVRRFDIAPGRCRDGGRRVHGRHPEQTSDALGACASQLGPRAVARAAQLNKELGLAVAKAARLLGELCGLRVSAGGLYQALHRQAEVAEPSYDALVEGVRHSPVVAPDETGWRVEGFRRWLWPFAGREVTVYLVAPGRGYDEATAVLGAEFAGVLERDGWAPSRRFEQARHQTCLAHLLRRAHG